MRNLARLSVGLLALLLVSSWSSTARQNQPGKAPNTPVVVFEAKATKPVYAKGGQIELNFTLRNDTGDAVIVTRQFELSLNVNLEITDSQGRPVEWCGRIAEVIPSKSLYRALSRGESVRAKLNINCTGKEDPRRAWGYNLNAPGKYVIKASYRLPQPKVVFDQLFPHEHVVRGPVSAEPITIELR